MNVLNVIASHDTDHRLKPNVASRLQAQFLPLPNAMYLRSRPVYKSLALLQECFLFTTSFSLVRT
jgi:hypothetical protein